MKHASFLKPGAVLLTALLIGACTSDEVSGPPAGITFAKVQKILTDNCGACHNAGSGRYFTVAMDSSELLQSGLVDPADPAESMILLKPTNATPHGGGLVEGLTAALQSEVTDWIATLPPLLPTVLDAIKVGDGTGIASPTVDGFYDVVWGEATPVRLRVTDGWGDAEFVTVQAAYDATYLYMLVVWDDDARSARRQPWIKLADGTWKKIAAKDPLPAANSTWSSYMGASFNEEDPSRFNYEDKLSVMWNTRGATTVTGFDESGCTVACHDPANGGAPGTGYNYAAQELAAKMYTNSPAEIADMWHWKYIRTDQHAKLDDQYLRYWVPGATGASNGGRATDAGSGGYVDNPALNGHPQYRGPSLSVPPYYILDAQKVVFTDAEIAARPVGAEIPSMITSGPTGSRGDVDAKGIHNLGTWAVEIRRMLVTGNADDVQFDDLTALYSFGVATFDNAQIEHRYTPMVARLAFKP